MGIASGNLRFRITILEPSEPSQTGAPVVEYSEAKEVFAEVLPLNARRQMTFRQSGYKSTHTVRFRYASFPGLTAEHRIRWSDTDWAIETMVDEDNRRDVWALTVVAGVNSGADGNG